MAYPCLNLINSLNRYKSRQNNTMGITQTPQVAKPGVFPINLTYLCFILIFLILKLKPSVNWCIGILSSMVFFRSCSITFAKVWRPFCCVESKFAVIFDQKVDV